MATYKDKSRKLVLDQIKTLVSNFKSPDFDCSKVLEEPGRTFLLELCTTFFQINVVEGDLEHLLSDEVLISPPAMAIIVRFFQRPDFNFLSPVHIFQFLQDVTLSALEGPEQSLACFMLALQVYTKYCTGGHKHLTSQEATILIGIILKYWGQAGHFGKISLYDVFCQLTVLGITPSEFAVYQVEHCVAALIGAPTPPKFCSKDVYEAADGKTLKPLLQYMPGLAFVNPEITYNEAELIWKCMQIKASDNVAAHIDGKDFLSMMLTNADKCWIFALAPESFNGVDQSVITRLRGMKTPDSSVLVPTQPVNPRDVPFAVFYDNLGFKTLGEIRAENERIEREKAARGYIWFLDGSVERLQRELKAIKDEKEKLEKNLHVEKQRTQESRATISSLHQTIAQNQNLQHHFNSLMNNKNAEMDKLKGQITLIDKIHYEAELEMNAKYDYAVRDRDNWYDKYHKSEGALSAYETNYRIFYDKLQYYLAHNKTLQQHVQELEAAFEKMSEQQRKTQAENQILQRENDALKAKLPEELYESVTDEEDADSERSKSRSPMATEEEEGDPTDCMPSNLSLHPGRRSRS